MENNSEILIYTEGGFKLGLGNIYRSVSLANALKKKGEGNIKFITSSDKTVSDIISKNGFSMLVLKKNNLLGEIIKCNPKVLIIDFLGLKENFAKKIKEKTNSKIVVIGNDSEANRFSDIVVNAIVGTNFKNKKHFNKKTLYLEGPKYLVLRDEFIKHRRKYIYREKLEKILLLFGGTDQANFTCKVLEDLLNYNKKSKITLVIGAGFKYERELDKFMQKYPDLDVKLHKNVSNVSEFMLDSDFVITSAGTSLFEGFCLGVPIIGLFQNRSQEKVFRNFFMTKKYQDIDNIGKFINSIYLNIDKYNKKLSSIKVGEGKEEIIDNILKL